MKTSVVILLLVLAAGRTQRAAAQSRGTFTATGNMTMPRTGHTATLLADGRVLIAGGNSFDGFGYKILSSAELYDPRTGRFTLTGNMTTPRSLHTATLLPDGRVLIAGGLRTNSLADALASAELYDPRTGTFNTTGEMSGARFGPATLLSNGKVLLAGWCYTSTGFGCFPGAELYDPDTGTFAATGNRNFVGVDTATLLPNGKVLLAGGDIGDGDGGSSIAELYDPANGTFSRTGNLTVGREQHTATLLPDGSVLFAGGHLVIDLAASAEIYDPIQGAFTRTANMPIAHEEHTATLLGDGTVLVAGGFMPWPALTSYAEIYHPAVLVPSPQLFSGSGDGRGQGAILHANTPQLASSDNPAAVGEALEIYLTGLGDGSLIPPQVSIGGRMAEVLWFGNTPGYAGLNQINVRVPNGVAPGPSVVARLTYLGRPSNEVTISVR